MEPSEAVEEGIPCTIKESLKGLKAESVDLAVDPDHGLRILP